MQVLDDRLSSFSFLMGDKEIVLAGGSDSLHDARVSLSRADDIVSDGLASEGLDLDPALDYLIELLPNHSPRPWPLKRPLYSIGRGRAKISLADRRVSRRHVVLTQLGPDWVAIHDHRASKPMAIGGWPLAQKTLRRGDVIRIGNTWLVFLPCTDPKASQPMHSIQGRLQEKVRERSGTAEPDDTAVADGMLEEVMQATASLGLYAGQQELAASSGRPLVIGRHPSCCLQLTDPSVAPFHCLVNWTPEGMCVFALEGDLSVSDRPVQRSLLQHGQQLGVGNVSLTIRIDGDPQEPASRRQQYMALTPSAAVLTAVYGPHRGESSLLPPRVTLTVGQSGDCDLAFPKSRCLSDCQLEIVLAGFSMGAVALRPAVLLRNLNPKVQVLVNGKRFDETATAQLGDVIQFRMGDQRLPTALMLHYDLASDSWSDES